MDVRQLGLSEQELEALGYRVSKRDDPAEPPSLTATPSLRRRGSGVRVWMWTLGTLLAVGWIARPSERLPEPVPANQPDTVFSSARAMSQLVDIAQAPRPVGSLEHSRVRDHLVERLTALGLEVRVQEQPVVAVEGDGAVVATVRNVIGRYPGTASTGAVVVTAHYDGPPLSPAAADNGIGLSAILETARALAAGGKLRNDIVFVLSDAKELGSLGVEAFLDEHPWSADVRAAVTLDALGGSGPMAWRRPEAGSAGVTATALAHVSGPGAYSLLDGLDGGPAFSGDLDAFDDRDIPVLGLVALGARAGHGGSLDRPIAVGEPTLQHAGAQLLPLVRALGSADFDGMAEASARSYVALPLGVVLDYPTSWGSLVAAAAVLVFILLFVLVRMRGGRWPGILAGTALGVVIIACGAGIGSLAVAFLPGFHAETGRLGAAYFEEGLLSVAMVALVVAVLSGLYALARKRYETPEVILGAWVAPFLVATTISLLAPEGQSVVQPALALAFGAFLALTLIPARSKPWRKLSVLALTAGTLVFIVPGVSILGQALTLAGAQALIASIAVASLLLLPILEELMRPKPWAIPAAGLVVASAALVLSAPGITDGTDHPELTTLSLLVDDSITAGEPLSVAEASGVAGAVIVASPPGMPFEPDAAAAPTDSPRWRASRWLTLSGSGSAWAESWVVDASGRGTPPGALLLPGTPEWVVAGAGPDALLPAPAVEVGPLDAGDPNRIDVRIHSEMGAEMVALMLPDGFPGTLEVAGGRQIPERVGSHEVRTVQFWGRPSSGPLTASIRLHAPGSKIQTPLVFEVIEHHLRPREILGESFFQRADSVMADPSTGTDRLVQRVQVRLPMLSQGPAPVQDPTP